MRFTLFLVVLAVLLALGSAANFKAMGQANMGRRSDLVKGERASNSQMHEVVFSVQRQNLDRLKLMVDDMSYPSSSNYGNFMTRSEVADLTANPVGTGLVLEYLSNHPEVTVVKQTRYGEFITASAPISTWESMFDTTFFDVEQKDPMGNTLSSVPRAMSYSIPEVLAPHVFAVLNTVQMPSRIRPRKITRQKMVNQNANPSIIQFGTVTPALINQFYNISSNTGNHLSSQSVYESIGQDYSPDDLTAFQQNFQLPIEAVASDIGGFNSSEVCNTDPGDCGEANLDVQYMMAVAQNVPTLYYYDNSTDFLLTWANDLLDMTNPPLVNSISYGDEETDLDEAYVQIFEGSAMMLSAIGVTIVASSGDDGAVSREVRVSTQFCGYAPSWPASSPYVLAVGATQGPESDSTEIACASDTGGVITSGGGFSNLYPMPSYQVESVQGTYFSNIAIALNQPVPGYNVTGRAYPDVSALGYNYNVLLGGVWYTESGTSASSPVVAAYIALVNSQRLAAGGSPVGWINPALYSSGYLAFTNDIVEGDNKCAAGYNVSALNCCDEGFNAISGWDPVTGFGSINFANFQKYYAYTADKDDDNALLSPEGVIAVSVVGGVVGAGAIGAGVYYGFFAKGAASGMTEPLNGAPTKSPMV